MREAWSKREGAGQRRALRENAKGGRGSIAGRMGAVAGGRRRYERGFALGCEVRADFWSDSVWSVEMSKG